MGKLTTLSKKMGGGLVGLILTHKMRRMILVVSTATYLHTLNRGGEFKLSNLNKEAKLSHDDKALDFPASLGDSLWKNCGLNEIDLHNGQDSVVTKIMDNIPPYLKYGRYSDMQKDVQTAVAFTLP